MGERERWRDIKSVKRGLKREGGWEVSERERKETKSY
jgi:hypothetical protein